jgi:hypothetical protein
MCGWAVTVDASGPCPLGHRIARPAPPPTAAAALPAAPDAEAVPDERSDALPDDVLGWSAPDPEEPHAPGGQALPTPTTVGLGLEAALLSALDELEAQVGALTSSPAVPERPDHQPPAGTQRPADSSPGATEGRADS